MRVCISSGHGKYIRGAAGPEPWGLDEVDEARKVVETTASMLRELGVEVMTFHDDVSKSQDENLRRIVDWHNQQTRDLDVSLHFNAFDGTAHGVECLYVTQVALADAVADEIAYAGGFTNRGPKKRTDLYFLGNTDEPAILVETAFCDNHGDCDLYRENYDAICDALACTLAGVSVDRPVPPEKPEEPDAAEGALFRAVGKCSWFGGPEDHGVSPDEGLAFISSIDDNPYLFLPQQPPGTTGLARRLNPYVHFVAARWDYDVTPKEMLRDGVALVTSKRTGYSLPAFPADWGPASETGRVADLSHGLLLDLELATDDEVEVIFPYNEDAIS